LWCGTAWASAKIPVPNAAEQKAALATVKEVFKTELAAAKSSAQFADVAERMLGNLQNDESSAVNDYVLLTQAHALAVKALRPTLSLQIVQRICERFDVDQHELTIQTLKDLAKGPTDKDHHKQLADLSFKMSLEHQRADRIEAASQHLELADALARRLKSSDMLKLATSRRAEITEYKKLVESVAAAEKKLAEAPSDAAANETLGRFLILAKSDWNEGLKRLVLASDATLQKLAKQDTTLIEGAKPPTTDEAAELADGWWDLAQKQSAGNFKTAVKLRAGQWYSFAAPNLKGLPKAKAEQRVTESGWTNDADLAVLMPLSRRDAVIQKAINSGKGMLSEKFAIVQTLPFADLVPLTEALKPRRWRPIRLRPYSTPEGLKIAAIWLPANSEGQLFDGTTEEVEKHDAENRAKGFTAVDLAGYLDANKQVRHILVSAKVKHAEGTNIDISAHQIVDGQTPYKAPASKGCAKMTYQIYSDAEGTRFADIVWRHPKGTFYSYRGGRVQWEKEVTRVSEKQMLLDVAIYAADKVAGYTASFQGADGFTATEIHGKTLDENLIEWQKLTEAKAHPAGVGVCVTSDGVYHSVSVWHGPK
jgi:hypothetical protein